MIDLYEFFFDVKFFVVICVIVVIEKEVCVKLIVVIDCNIVNLGVWLDGDLIICEVLFDNFDEDIFVEIDGEVV